jgi:hypothetical protein
LALSLAHSIRLEAQKTCQRPLTHDDEMRRTFPSCLRHGTGKQPQPPMYPPIGCPNPHYQHYFDNKKRFVWIYSLVRSTIIRSHNGTRSSCIFNSSWKRDGRIIMHQCEKSCLQETRVNVNLLPPIYIARREVSGATSNPRVDTI